jgi:hypothetical protein
MPVYIELAYVIQERACFPLKFLSSKRLKNTKQVNIGSKYHYFSIPDVYIYKKSWYDLYLVKCNKFQFMHYVDSPRLEIVLMKERTK